MFDVGFLEIVVIGVVSLVVIGPERLPEVAAKVGRTVGKAQRFVRGVRSDISRELESGDLKKILGDQKAQIEELRSMVQSASSDFKSSTNSALKEAEKSFSEIKTATEIKSSTSQTSEQVRYDAEPEAAADSAVVVKPAGTDASTQTGVSSAGASNVTEQTVSLTEQAAATPIESSTPNQSGKAST